MDKTNEPVYSRHVIEFVAVASEYCKYAEHAGDLKGEDLLKILQRLLPLLYLKATFLPEMQPVFEDGNEKFVTEGDWFRIHDAFKSKFGSADDYNEVFDERADEAEAEGHIVSSLAENMTDIYQDLKNFLLLYQTGTDEVMNDAIWECRLNFENYWGQKLVNALRAIHKFISSGDVIHEVEDDKDNTEDKKNKSEWFISRRQKEFRESDEGNIF